MQDEVNTKVVAIMIKGGKISAEVLKKALDKFVQEIEKAQKQMQQPKTYRGKQSIKHLMSQNAAISNIEVTDGNIKSFERVARKYGPPPSRSSPQKPSSRRNSRPSGTSWIRRKLRARRSTRRRLRSKPRIGVWSCEQARFEEAHSSEPSVCLRLLLRG